MLSQLPDSMVRRIVEQQTVVYRNKQSFIIRLSGDERTNLLSSLCATTERRRPPLFVSV